MQKFRRGVPEKSSVYICKNSLMKEAVKTVPGWEVLGEQGCTVSNSSIAKMNGISLACGWATRAVDALCLKVAVLVRSHVACTAPAV
jgi:hypothetical protein